MKFQHPGGPYPRVAVLTALIVTQALSSHLFPKTFGATFDDDSTFLDQHYRRHAAPSPGQPDLFWEWEPQPRWLAGVNFGGETFEGSVSRGAGFFGTTLLDSEYVEVEIRFSSTETTICQTYRRDMGFAAAGAGVFRGSAWDISAPGEPRRLNICFVESDDGSGRKPANRLWDPDTSRFGGREYLFIMRSDYDGTGLTYDDRNWGPAADVLYGWWPRLENGHDFLESDPAVLRIRFAHIRKFRAIPDDGKIILSWVFDRQDAERLLLYTGTSSPANTLIASFQSRLLTYEHTGLDNNTLRFYRMEAVSSTGEVRYVSAEISAQPQVVSQNVDLLGFWHQRQKYGDIWGYTDAATGREYALLCVRNQGLSIIDLTPPMPVEVGFAEAIRPNVSSKDVKVYQHYAILINEEAPAQIIDIEDPSRPVTVSTISFDNIAAAGGAHNCYVDGHYLYITGNHGIGGLLIFDIEQPATPRFVGKFEPYYYHDIYVRNDTAYAAAIFGQGVDLLDVAVKSRPTLIANFNYPGSGAHNTWTTEDGAFLFVGDEVGSAGNHTRVFDIRDLNRIEKVADIIVDPRAITHNCYVKGDFLYIAHYTEGVRIIDVATPTAPRELGYYDTYVQPGFGFNGSWSVYPYFESGRLIASDIQTGLYVLRFHSPRVSVDQQDPEVPNQFELEQNYPNPFSRGSGLARNSSTEIRFRVPVLTHVNLTVYSLLGQVVRTLRDRLIEAGLHQAIWDGRDDAGKPVAGGVYLLRMTAAGGNKEAESVLVRKMLLVE